MALTPLEVMERLSATWGPRGMQDAGTVDQWVELFDPSVVLTEPSSLPHGGRHEGVAEFRSAQTAMRSLWEQTIETADYWQCGPEIVTLRIVIRWTARSTGRSAVIPMIDLIHFRSGKIVEVEAFLSDTKTLLDTLG